MICYYNNKTKQYFWVKDEFKSTTNCDHLERCKEKDNLHEKLAKTEAALKVAEEAIGKLAEIREHARLDDYDAYRAIQQSLDFTEKEAMQAQQQINKIMEREG